MELGGCLGTLNRQHSEITGEPSVEVRDFARAELVTSGTPGRRGGRRWAHAGSMRFQRSLKKQKSAIPEPLWVLAKNGAPDRGATPTRCGQTQLSAYPPPVTRLSRFGGAGPL
jgi:hypothetical protein